MMNSFASSIYAATKSYVPTVQLNISLISSKKDREYKGLSPDKDIIINSSSAITSAGCKTTDETSVKSAATTLRSTSSAENDSSDYNLLLEENDLLRSELYRMQRLRRVTASADSLCTRRNISLDLVDKKININSDDLRTSYDNDSGSDYSNDWETYSNESKAPREVDLDTSKDFLVLPEDDFDIHRIANCNDDDEDKDEDDINSARNSRSSLNKSAYIRKLLNRITEFEEEKTLLDEQLLQLSDRETSQQATIHSLTEQCRKLDYNKAQMTAELLQLVPLQLKANEMKSAIAAYRGSLADKESIVRECSALRSQVDKLTRKSEASSKEVQLLAASAAAFAELQQRSHKWEEDHQSLVAVSARLRDKLDQALTERNHHEHLNQSLKKEITRTANIISTLEQKFAAIEIALAEREDEIALLSEKLASRSRGALSSFKGLSSCGGSDTGMLQGRDLLGSPEGWGLFSCAATEYPKSQYSVAPSSPKKNHRC